MKELEEGGDFSSISTLRCTGLLDQFTTGVSIMDRITKIRLFCIPEDGYAESGMPTLMVFDSLDGRIQTTEAKRKDLLYSEFCRIRFDGHTERGEARRLETQEIPEENRDVPEDGKKQTEHVIRYDIEAMRYNDHMKIRITGKGMTRQTIVALPDSSRYSYLALTGEHCTLRGIQTVQEDEPVTPEMIPRIAEEISFIRGCPQGDIPNVQIDRWRSAATEGLPVTDGLVLRFHAMSLPTARLIWHCPFVSIYTARDRRVNGEGFREFALIRLDGENWESDDHVENELMINKNARFTGWNEWKTRLREGIDCEVLLRREGGRITVSTENLGISIQCVTKILDETEDVYVALTGDQCAITNIRTGNAG
jgi:hypothetical protein